MAKKRKRLTQVALLACMCLLAQGCSLAQYVWDTGESSGANLLWKIPLTPVAIAGDIAMAPVYIAGGICFLLNPPNWNFGSPQW